VLGSAQIDGPIFAGLRRPANLIPQRLLAELSRQELISVAFHEAAHLVGGDDYALLAERVLQALWPFCFPAGYYAAGH
jgi:beta-lactamase regulating signal transducer with metallopeptidase domain